MEIAASDILIHFWEKQRYARYRDKTAYCIYVIRCAGNGKVYVGRSEHISERFRNHAYRLRHGYHANKGLQADFDKYGESMFSISVIDVTNNPQLEFEYIKRFHAYDPECGYNNDILSKKLWAEGK